MIFGIWGEDKTAKTTLALTFPKPMVYMEFDIGGFDRAIYRFRSDYQSGLIRYEAYPMPMSFGKLDPKNLQIRPSKLVVGMKELFYQWATKYIGHLQVAEIASIVIDTFTLHYSITCDAYLQELQEKQLPLAPNGKGSDGKTLRTQLQQIEYREPNTRIRGVLYQAKSHHKHLVLVHHARDEYKPMPQRDGMVATSATGKRERAGFATLGDSADVIVRTYLQTDKVPDSNPPTTQVVPYCEVELAEVLPLVGMKYREPSYDKITTNIKMLKGEL